MVHSTATDDAGGTSGPIPWRRSPTRSGSASISRTGSASAPPPKCGRRRRARHQRSRPPQSRGNERNVTSKSHGGWMTLALCGSQ